MYWQNTKTLRYFFALISVVVIASLVIVVGLGSRNHANALTAAQQQNCYDTWNAQWDNPGDSNGKGVLKMCVDAKYCSEGPFVSDALIGHYVVTCINPAIQAAASSAAAKAVTAPLIKAVCGTAPPITNQTGAYLACSNKVVTDYNACSMTGGGVTGNALDTPQNTARCFVAKDPSISAFDASTAIIQGRAAGAAITTAAANLQAKTACEAGGGTFNASNVCVPKPAAITVPTSSCVVDGIGWIVCPVMNFMAKIVDGAYGIVSTLLVTPSINTNTSDPANATYQAWQIMRTIANVAFVIAFLLIIFSQLTSIGITNYGVKKMLPRLVIAAILVNLSYYICAIGVDISNILGSSMKQLLDSVGLKIPDIQAGSSQTGSGWAGAVGFLLAGGLASVAALYAGLSILLPALIAALVAIVTVFLVLTLRQALIIILIVISPLAFVAFLLPNTENLFKKWRELFTTLLLMFPIIAIIFGGSALASKVIMASSTSFTVQIMGALVAIIPLFITPVVMKSAGSLLNNFSGFVKKEPFSGRMRKSAEGYRNNRLEYRNLKAMNGESNLPGMSAWSRRKAGRAAILNNRKTELNRSNASYVSDQSATDSGFRDKLAQGGGPGAEDRALSSSLNVRKKLENEEIEHAVERMVSKSDPTELPDIAKAAFKSATSSGDTTQARAAFKILATQLGAPGIQVLHDAISEIEDAGTGNVDTITELKRDVNSSGMKGKDNAIASWGWKAEKDAAGNTVMPTIKSLETDTGTFSGLNPTELAGQNIANLNKAVGLNGDQARGVLTNQNASQLLSEEKRAFFENISQNQPPTTPTTSP